MKTINEIEKTAKNSRKVPPSCFEWLFKLLFRTASKFWISFSGSWLLRSIAYEVFRTLIDLNPEFMKEIFNRICSFPKQTKYW